MAFGMKSKNEKLDNMAKFQFKMAIEMEKKPYVIKLKMEN